MNSITITYRLIMQFKTHNYIQLSVCGKYFNVKNSKEIKLKVCGGSIGIWLDSKTFLIKSKIAENLEPIPKYKFIGNDFLTNL